jgi:hypothetical protein
LEEWNDGKMEKCNARRNGWELCFALIIEDEEQNEDEEDVNPQSTSGQ